MCSLEGSQNSQRSASVLTNLSAAVLAWCSNKAVTMHLQQTCSWVALGRVVYESVVMGDFNTVLCDVAKQHMCSKSKSQSSTKTDIDLFEKFSCQCHAE